MTEADLDRALSLLHEEVREMRAWLVTQLVCAGQEYLTLTQAASLLALDEDDIRRAVKAGEMAMSNLGTEVWPRYRVSRAELMGWANRRAGRLV